MEKIISLSKRRGFIYQGSEIYDGLAGTWDYGPLGVVLKRNIESLWRKQFVDERDDMYELESALIMNPKVWEASGHVEGFSDPLVECQKCKEKFRADYLINTASDLEAVKKEWYRRAKKIDDEIQALPSFKAKEVFQQFDPILEKIKDDKEITSEQKIAFNKIYIRAINHAIEANEAKMEVIEKKMDILKELINSESYIGLVFHDYLNRFVSCPRCRAQEKWKSPTAFNMMFETHIGAAQDDASMTYLRPETAQGMFVNFKNIIDSFHPELPFGIAQIGKAFRNEIAPRDFMFRSREFSQMEIEYFVRENEWEKHFEMWRKEMLSWMGRIGLSPASVHEYEVPAEDRAHYSKRTIDFEFEYPFGKKELYGLAYRTDFDLKNHMEKSGVDLRYYDEKANERFLPHVIEPTFGIDRTVMAVLASSYTEDEMGEEKRVVLKFPYTLAPIKVAVFPLLKNRPELIEKAKSVFAKVKQTIPSAIFDDNGNIGKRYRRQDEIGTPFCVTVDFQTLEDGTATVRERNSGKQERISIDELSSSLKAE
ncbi:MAG: glycine--tRNA ligase [Patescibacteria group bacterium]|nr:glycine--tRNA ligase [bacterium]MDZ4241022.1 glycine--tRNA ligase [Patescibacteria group bacterium]